MHRLFWKMISSAFHSLEIRPRSKGKICIFSLVDFTWFHDISTLVVRQMQSFTGPKLDWLK
jgi:hypothetical protein